MSDQDLDFQRLFRAASWRVRRDWDFLTPEQHLERYREAYERDRKRDRNPLFVWAARDLTRHYEMDQPDWVTDYFDEVGQLLLALGPRDDPQPADGPPGAIGKRLGFQVGLATARKRFRKAVHADDKQGLATRVVTRMYDRGLSADAACSEIDGWSRSEAWRALNRAGDSVERLMALFVTRLGGEIPPRVGLLRKLSDLCVASGPQRNKRTPPT